jgi:hypothetical protein
MNRTSQLAALCLVVGSVAGPVLAQTAGGTPAKAAAAAKLAKLKAQQDAALQAAKAKAATPPTPTAAPTINTRQIPTATPTTTTTTPPTPTTPPTTTTTPAATASAKATASASSSAKPPGSAVPVSSAAPLPPKDHTDTAAIALDLEALKKSRPDRRHAEILDLQQRWGNLLSDPRATAELKQHAQRIAYLQRIRALAVKANDAKLVKDVDLLLTKEELRDANVMNGLRSGALPGGAP